MTEEIYIDGERLDIEEGGGGIQLVYQSPYFTDLSAIVSNRTNQVTLPMTARNRRVIGYTGTQADALFAYRKHAVAYKRDGVQIFSGQATLLTITPDKFTMCFVWGNADKFQVLFDTQLSALGEYGREHETYIEYHTPNQGSQDGHYSKLMKFGAGRQQPIASVSELLYRMWRKFGHEALYRDEWLYYFIPLMTRKGDVETRRRQGIYCFSSGLRRELLGTFSHILLGKGTDNYIDPHDYMNEQHIMTFGDARTLRIVMRGTLSFVVTTSGGSIYDAKMVLRGLDPDTNSWTDISGTLATASVTQLTQYGWQISYANVNIDRTFDIHGYSSVCVSVQTGTTATPYMPVTEALEVCTFIPDADEPEEVLYGRTAYQSPYPMYLNMPEISCGQLIKNLMRISGLFAHTDSSGDIAFTSLADLYANRAQAVNWTDRVLLTSGKPTEYKGTMDGVAQRNWLRWKEDDSIPQGKYDAYMPSDNETAEAEAEVFTGDFNLAPDNYIPVWTQEEEGAEIEFQGDSLTPRILRGESTISAQTAQNDDNLAWSKILTARYAEYKQIILHPVTIRVSVLVSTAELHALDLTIPVYLRQTGRYYCIKQLTTKNGTEAEAELIQM